MKKNTVNTKAATKLTAAILSVLTSVTLPVTALAAVEEEVLAPQTVIAEEYVVDNENAAAALGEDEASAEEAEAAENNLPEDPHGTPAPDEIVGELPTASTESEAPLLQQPVATMCICSSGPHLPYLFGHAWILVHNISNRILTVGDQLLHPGEWTSIGLHGQVGREFGRELGEFEGRAVNKLEASLTEAQLDAANREIMNARWTGYSMLLKNCTNFATAVWKAATGQFIASACFPFIVSLSILAHGASRVVVNTQTTYDYAA